jgi:PAS domain S-box-containing protein
MTRDPRDSEAELEIRALRRRLAVLESREGRHRQAEERAVRLGRMLDDSLNEIYVFDAETLHYTEANRNARENLGYSLAALLGLTPLDLMPGLTPEDLVSFLEPLHGGQEDRIRFTTQHRRRNGSLYPVEVDLHLSHGAASKEFVAIALDITEREKAEEELHRTQRQLLQAQKLEAVGQLAGGIAHDFNNYLTVILGNVELLALDLPEEGTAKRVLGEIEKAGRQSAALTQQLLAFSRAQVLEPRVVDLNRIVSGVEAMLERILGEDIDLHFETETTPAPVLVDPSQLEQVIVNLAVNARDAMPRGGTLSLVTGDVYLDEEFAAEHPGIHPGRHAMLAVSDTGTGMDPEVLSQIFEPFFTTKGKDRGTGLGLSTVFGILRQSGGSISVESQPGRGTTFRIYLPLVETEADSEPPIAVSADLPRGSETILLAEDQAMVRRVTRAFLEARGYAVVEAEDGRRALALLESDASRFDLLIADVIMPRMGGFELAARARDLEPELPVLLMSGYAEPAPEHRGEHASGMPLLKKPFTARELLEKLSLALHR